jgi:citrate synthase
MTVEDVADWWATGISRIEPGVIELRGRPVQELLGTTGFVETIWLMLRGDLPDPRRAALLEAALVASVDHGPHAPSIAVARMSATCGIGLNGAMANGVNVLGDVHGGAGQQCVELLNEACEADSVDDVIAAWRARDPYLPGFGHRFHRVDPRREPLLSLVDAAVRDGVVAGRHLAAGRAIEAALATVPMNVDGATAIIYAELGFAAPLARGLFVLGRSVGILAHAWEETQQGRRIKGPIPPGIQPTYRPTHRS